MQRIPCFVLAWALLATACSSGSDSGGGTPNTGGSSAGGSSGSGNGSAAGGSDASTGGSAGGGTGGSGGASGSSGSGGSAGQAQTAAFDVVVLDAAPSVELRATTELTVNVAPNGYVGPVSMSATGLPADVTAVFASPTLNLDGSTTLSTSLELTTKSDSTTGAYPFSVVASATEGDKAAAATLTIQAFITITIPLDVHSLGTTPPNTTAFGDYPTVVKALPNMSETNTITVRFFNADSIPHEIHAAQPDEGFPHGAGSIPPSGHEDRFVNSSGQYDYYLHDEIPISNIGRLTIQ